MMGGWRGLWCLGRSIRDGSVMGVSSSLRGVLGGGRFDLLMRLRFDDVAVGFYWLFDLLVVR